MVRSQRSFGFWCVAMFLAIILMRQEYHIWFGDEGMPYLNRLTEVHQRQAHKNMVLESENNQLLVRIRHYKSSPEAMEGVLRSHMHMVKKNELFFAYPAHQPSK